MMRVLLATLMLFTLTACNPVLDSPAKQASSVTTSKPLPYAPPPPPLPDEAVACAADVKPCPDGSFVSRNPAASCSFDPCPGKPTP